jgi:hypothetical protein
MFTAEVLVHMRTRHQNIPRLSGSARVGKSTTLTGRRFPARAGRPLGSAQESEPWRRPRAGEALQGGRVPYYPAKQAAPKIAEGSI